MQMAKPSDATIALAVTGAYARFVRYGPSCALRRSALAFFVRFYVLHGSRLHSFTRFRAFLLFQPLLQQVRAKQNRRKLGIFKNDGVSFSNVSAREELDEPGHVAPLVLLEVGHDDPLGLLQGFLQLLFVRKIKHLPIRVPRDLRIACADQHSLTRRFLAQKIQCPEERRITKGSVREALPRVEEI